MRFVHNEQHNVENQVLVVKLPFVVLNPASGGRPPLLRPSYVGRLPASLEMRFWKIFAHFAMLSSLPNSYSNQLALVGFVNAVHAGPFQASGTVRACDFHQRSALWAHNL